MGNNEELTVTVDKFIFRVPRDCRYGNGDVWARREGNRIRIGLTDFLQQKSGDIAFVEVKPVATRLSADEEFAAVETIKVDLIVPAPLAGTIIAVNPALTERIEVVNADPYGEGWLAELEPTDWAEYERLLDAETYLPQMKARAELEREQ